MTEWFHSVPELKIEGMTNLEQERFVMQAIPEKLNGKSVLDLGAYDGYYSYVAWKRGAQIVVAVDNAESQKKNFTPEHQTAVEQLYAKYNTLNRKLKANIHFIPLNAFNMDKILMNFDVVFCFGLFYHVKNPYELLEKCFQKCNELLLLEGAISDTETATMYMNDAYELNQDPTNYWTPSENCLKKMLKRIGFIEVDTVAKTKWSHVTRILLRCYK